MKLLPCLFLFYLIIFFSCTKNEVKIYLDNLPENEVSNVSAKNYKLIQNKIEDDIKNIKYISALSNILGFYRIFKEDNKGYILYDLGIILEQITTNTNFFIFYKNLTSDEKLIFKINCKKMIYEKEDFYEILKERPDYFLEKKAAVKANTANFQPASNYISFLTNFYTLEKFSKYYPDAELIENYFKENSYFPEKYFLNKQMKKEFDEMTNLISSCRVTCTNGKLSFLQGDFINARNKPNIAYSRLISPLEGWEEVKVIKKIYDKNTNETWVQVLFHDNKNGFMPIENIDTNFPYSNENPRLLKIYRKALEQYYNEDYLDAAETISRLAVKTRHKSRLIEKSIIFFYKINSKIAEYATCRKSKYFKYVKSYPEYFLFDENTQSLKCSNLLFKYMIKNYPESKFLFYFK